MQIKPLWIGVVLVFVWVITARSETVDTGGSANARSRIDQHADDSDAEQATRMVSDSSGVTNGASNAQPAAAGQDESVPAEPVGAPPPRAASPPIQLSDTIDQGGVLTKRNSLVMEPSLQFSNSAVNSVALEGFTILPGLTVGYINVSEVSRNALIAALDTRYGVTNRFELEGRLPYVWRWDVSTGRPLEQDATSDVTTKSTGRNIGDIEVAGHYQFSRTGYDSPFYVGNLRIKSRTGTDPFGISVDPATGLQKRLPTGSGFWGIQPSLTFGVPSDPAIFFGNLNYFHSFDRRIGSLGTIEPGDAIGISGGMGIAINARASISFGYSHTVVEPSMQNNSRIKGSETLQVGSLVLGVSYRMDNRTSINVSINAGVTQDAPNVLVAVRLPTSFDLKGVNFMN